eukprot:2575227-Prymnesium_polylepis.1
MTISNGSTIAYSKAGRKGGALAISNGTLMLLESLISNSFVHRAQAAQMPFSPYVCTAGPRRTR